MLPEQIAPSLVLVRRLAGVLVVVLCTFSIHFAHARSDPTNVEQITGVVVAYDELKPSLTCIQLCETSLIVRVDEPSEEKPNYIRIDLKFTDFPKGLITNKRRWRFKLVRTAERDEKLEEFIRGEDVYGKEIKSPIWRRVPGAEEEKLPFGDVLRSYSLSKRDFKLAGD